MRWMLAALLMSGPVVGQEVHRCDEVAIAEMLAEPFEDSAKAFANGDVSLSVLDIEEPAAEAAWFQPTPLQITLNQATGAIGAMLK